MEKKDKTQETSKSGKYIYDALQGKIVKISADIPKLKRAKKCQYANKPACCNGCCEN